MKKLGIGDYVRITRPSGTECGSDNPNNSNGFITKICKDGTAKVKVKGADTKHNWESTKWLTVL